MGRKLLANGQTEKWKVRLVGCGDQQTPGGYIDITSPVIDSASVRLALGHAAKYDIEIAVLDIRLVFSAALCKRLSRCGSPMTSGLMTPIDEPAESSS
jgi:hypothetical protein